MKLNLTQLGLSDYIGELGLTDQYLVLRYIDTAIAAYNRRYANGKERICEYQVLSRVQEKVNANISF